MRWVLGIFIGVLLVLPAAAGAATVTEVTMLSQKGDYIGEGTPRVFDSTNATIRPNSNSRPSDVSLDVMQADGTDWTFEFAPQQNGEEPLKPGLYDNAWRVISHDATHPGIDIFGDGRGCNSDKGRFEVKDVAFDSAGALQRLWVVFEQHCEWGTPALFGDVRYNEPATDGAPIAAPTVQRWPEGDIGQATDPQPVTFIAPAGGMTVSSAVISGANAADFTVAGDTCTGKAIAAGARCQLVVKFTPGAAGTRVASLRVTDSAGHAVDVPLQGWNHGGRTHLAMQSDAGDFIGAGQNYDYTLANMPFAAGGSNKHVAVAVASTNDRWSLEFAPPPSGVLAPGRYAPATRYPFNDQNAGLSVYGEGRGCNVSSGEFTVTEARFDGDGNVSGFAASFVQHCENQTPALHGTVEWRAGDSAAPAPWMNGGAAAEQPPGTSPPPTTGSAPAASSDPCAAPAFAKAKQRKGTKRSNRIRGSKKPEVIRAGAGNDVVRAGGGSDCVDGGAGRDRIDGGAGNDVLIGGPGRDVLICGSGRDTAIVGPGDRTRGCEAKVRVKR